MLPRRLWQQLSGIRRSILNANGDAWGAAMVEYVKRHWLIILSIFAIAIWVTDVRAGTRDRYTASEAAIDKAKIELLIHQSVQNIEIDIAEMRGDMKAMRKDIEDLKEE